MPWRLSESKVFGACVLAGFLFLSLADLYLTWYLIAPRGDPTLESNPLARFVLEISGWAGITAYKLSLMFVIGLAVLIVTRQKPRAAELVLTFGCGAQAAVVLSSVFLLCSLEKYQAELSPPTSANVPPHAPCDAFPPDGIALLMQKPIQEDLGLSERQVTDITAMAQRAQAIRLRLPTIATDDLRDFASQVQEIERCVAAKLSAQQRQRLLQLSWQNRGALAFGDWEISSRLKLTSEQHRAVVRLLEGARDLGRRRLTTQAGPSPSEQMAQIKIQLVDLLTPEQRARWDQIIGRPFPFEQRVGLRTFEQVQQAVD